jgi:hypothetical protein
VLESKDMTIELEPPFNPGRFILMNHPGNDWKMYMYRRGTRQCSYTGDDQTTLDYLSKEYVEQMKLRIVPEG